MADKPSTAAGYTSEHLELVRSTCLYVATKLGDLMNELVIVGGLVPSLLIDQQALPDGTEAHVGTTDLDVGLTQRPSWIPAREVSTPATTQRDMYLP